MAENQPAGSSSLINETWFAETPQGTGLAASRCPGCGRTYFPRKRVCPQCFQIDQMQDVVLGRRGKLYTFTVIEAGPPGFSVPYAVGYVDLPGGVRVFSQLEGDPGSFQIGMEMELTIGPIREVNGIEVTGHKFRPV